MKKFKIGTGGVETFVIYKEIVSKSFILLALERVFSIAHLVEIFRLLQLSCQDALKFAIASEDGVTNCWFSLRDNRHFQEAIVRTLKQRRTDEIGT